MDVVFHLAAIHGGRGYVDLHQAPCAQNLAMDGMLVKAAHEGGVEKFVFASSGCVYPNHLQTDVSQELYLTEEMVGPPYDADNMYGWAKLMTELTLQAYHQDFGFKSASCRFFTVYGERGVENHAVIAMIARAFVKQNPFEVWGDGTQVRNWTYVGDIVSGMVLAAEKIDDGTAINLGTEERTRVIDAVREVLRYTGQEAEIKLLPHMPTGPLNRVASNSLAKRAARLGAQDEVHRRPPPHHRLVLRDPPARDGERLPRGDADRALIGVRRVGLRDVFEPQRAARLEGLRDVRATAFSLALGRHAGSIDAPAYRRSAHGPASRLAVSEPIDCSRHLDSRRKHVPGVPIRQEGDSGRRRRRDIDGFTLVIAAQVAHQRLRSNLPTNQIPDVVARLVHERDRLDPRRTMRRVDVHDAAVTSQRGPVPILYVTKELGGGIVRRHARSCGRQVRRSTTACACFRRISIPFSERDNAHEFDW